VSDADDERFRTLWLLQRCLAGGMERAVRIGKNETPVTKELESIPAPKQAALEKTTAQSTGAASPSAPALYGSHPGVSRMGS